jgi:hypothetical protein
MLCGENLNTLLIAVFRDTMPIFKSPQYSKKQNAITGAVEPCYTFNIELLDNDAQFTFVAESQFDISLQSLQNSILDNVTEWNTFIEEFLKVSSKLFVKPYTVDTIHKLTKHTLDKSNDINDDEFPVTVTLIPKNIQICKGNFLMNWRFEAEKMLIDIPDLEEEEEEKQQTTELNTSLPPVSEEGIQELSIDELPEDNTSTVSEFNFKDSARYYEKRRVKEARLKAKLAIYKAERQMNTYYEKYGTDVSDSSDSSDDDSEV